MPQESDIGSESDEQLARRAQDGCTVSFEELAKRFQVPVLHFLRHRGHGADAEDLLQDTLLRAYENLHRYSQRWRFATWLFTIARRISINYHRRHRPPGGDQVLVRAVSASPGPDELLADKDEGRWLWRTAREVLSEEQMSGLWLYYVEEMPVKELAAVLERSNEATKTLLFRARKQLAPHLECLDPHSSGT